MESDIKLNDGNVSVEGDSIDVQVPIVKLGKRPNGQQYLLLDNDTLYLSAQTLNIQSQSDGKLAGITLKADDKNITMAGDTLTLEGKTVNMGGQSSDNKYVGITIGPAEHSVYLKGAVIITNPWLALPDTKARIALQQSDDDKLILNDGGNFTGGVRIEGEIHLAGLTVCEGDLNLSGDHKINVTTWEEIPPKTVGGKTIGGETIRTPVTYDLLSRVNSLFQQITDLESKLAALEEKLKTKVPGW